jgi:membrane protein implicated in regulation of membrane protease activity
VGAMLLAWSIAAIQVMARPGGKAVFVTTGALQLTFGALAFLYSWSVREYGWNVWYQAFASILLSGAAIYLWWARMSARKVLKGVGSG